MTYLYHCPTCGQYESTSPTLAACPECGKPGRRVFASVPLRGWKGSSKEAK